MGDFSYVYKLPGGLSKHIVVEPSMVKIKRRRPLLPGHTLCGRLEAEMLPLPDGKQLHLCEQCRQVRNELAR
jgi:hypothetical protein